MIFINQTETIGIIMGNASSTTTGSMFLTMLLVLILILAFAIMFGIKMEFTAMLILPLMLGYMSYYGEFIAIGLVILIYIGIIFTKNFIFK